MVSLARWSWVDLPREVTASILSRLTAAEILKSAQFVCKAWFEVSKDPLVWKRIDFDSRSEVEICRRAVDRSCGQAVEVSMYAADDDLLEFISERSSRIERLRLIECHGVSEEGLFKAVEKLPSLEDLDLTLCWFLPETIEDIGQKCPRLKAFKLNSEAADWLDFQADEEDELNGEAVAIGKNMPGLKSLQLISNCLTNKGLGAILDGCPGLESLDLRCCCNVNLEGKVWKRCVEQIKRLRLPGDSLNDYIFPTGSNNEDSEYGYDDDDDDDDGDDDDDDSDDADSDYAEFLRDYVG